MVFTFVVGFMIVGLSVLILIVEVRNPAADTGIIANTLMSLVSGILGCPARAHRRQVLVGGQLEPASRWH